MSNDSGLEVNKHSDLEVAHQKANGTVRQSDYSKRAAELPDRDSRDQKPSGERKHPRLRTWTAAAIAALVSAVIFGAAIGGGLGASLGKCQSQKR